MKMKQSRRVVTPLVLQLEATECGAAALGIILEYYGRVVSLTELREECGVSRDGSKASNVLRAARKYGLKCKGFKETLQSSMELKCPYIVFWDFDHFLVVEGFDHRKKIVFLNDPAQGHRKVTFDEFDGSFTGVALLFEPSEEFTRGGKRPSIVEAITRRLAHSRAALLYLLLSGLILTVPGLIIPAYTRVYLDRVIGESRMDWLQPLITAIGVTIIFKLVMEIAKYACLRRMRILLSASMSREFFEHLLHLPLKFYSQRYSGEIAWRETLNDNMAEILSGKLANTAINVIMMIFYSALMMFYNVRLTLIGIFLAGISFYMLKVLGKHRADANMRMRQDFGKVVGYSISALQSMETIKVSGQESSFFTRWSGRYSKAVNSMQDLQVATQSLAILPLFFKSLNTMFNLRLISDAALTRVSRSPLEKRRKKAGLNFSKRSHRAD